MLKNSVVYIYEVYREKSFSKAAQKLYVSQPTLSTAIQKEEAHWGCTFFDRSSNPIVLTPAGEYYISVVEKMQAIEEELKAYFDQHIRERRQQLNIGAPSFFCTYVLPTLVKEFKAQHTGCRVNIIEAGDSDLANCLQAGTIDVCLTVENWPRNTYRSIPIGKEEVILAVPALFSVNERLSDLQLNPENIVDYAVCREDCPKVSIGEFKSLPFLLLKKGNDMCDRGTQICQQADFTPNVFMTLDQLLTSFHMAAAGMGATFIRAGLMKYIDYGDDLCFYRLDSPHTIRNINLVYKKSGTQTTIIEEFITHLSKQNLGKITE